MIVTLFKGIRIEEQPFVFECTGIWPGRVEITGHDATLWLPSHATTVEEVCATILRMADADITPKTHNSMISTASLSTSVDDLRFTRAGSDPYWIKIRDAEPVIRSATLIKDPELSLHLNSVDGFCAAYRRAAAEELGYPTREVE